MASFHLLLAGLTESGVLAHEDGESVQDAIEPVRTISGILGIDYRVY